MSKFYKYIPGCTYEVYDKEKLKKIMATGNFHLINIYYLYKPWWKFWLKKTINYYEIMCIETTWFEPCWK